MRAVPPPRPATAVFVLLALAAPLAGCGKSGSPSSGGEPSGAVPPLSAQGAAGVTMRNTTRLGGADPATDAAAVALTVYPGLTSATRPRAVVLADEHDWAGSLVASALASSALRAPLLYGENGALPEASQQALRTLRPVGAPALGGTQVIRIGSAAAVPGGLTTRTVPSTGGPAAVAVAVERLLAVAGGGAPRQVIVVSAEAPRALQMLAAGLSAESGAPILFVAAGSVPAATAVALKGLRRPAIYVVDPASVGRATMTALAHFGPVTPIVEGPSPAGAVGYTPTENANAVARFTDGQFGWGVKEPGHGLVFANAGRPFDAPAAALLSASGDYGPLLLLESPHAVPPPLARYLADIQPAYGSAPQFQPVHGAYNHGWLIGGERAISLVTQAEIDFMLEIAPRRVPPEEEPPASTAEAPPSPATESEP